MADAEQVDPSAPVEGLGALPEALAAEIRESQSIIRAALADAASALAVRGIALELLAGSAILADIDLGDGMRRRAVSASILVPFAKVDEAVRAFRAAGFDLGQPVEESEIIRAAGRRRVIYSLIEPEGEPAVASLRLPRAHPASAEAFVERTALVRATITRQIAATLSRVRRRRSEYEDVSESEEFRIVPYEP